MLARYVDAYARENAVAPGRVRRLISFMALAGVLRKTAHDQETPRFVVKGGVALELRLRGRARATKDLDVILNRDEGNLLDEIERAIARPYESFAFRRKGEAHMMPTGALRVKVQVEYRGREWGTVEMDVAYREGETEVELLEGVDLLTDFGIQGPEEVECLAPRHHVAQKLHGMTQTPPEGRRNERFRDLVDLLLMREFVEDYVALREACEEVFARRGTHKWPPVIAPPEEWREPFAEMAREIGLPITDLDAAVEEAIIFVRRVEVARKP